MVKIKGLDYKKQLSSYDRWYKSLHEQYSNPDWLSNCISYCVNDTWYIRSKSQNNQIVKTYKTYEEYLEWQDSVLYDDW